MKEFTFNTKQGTVKILSPDYVSPQEAHLMLDNFLRDVCTSPYSGDPDWGPSVLNRKEAVQLAIETLENFRDEYSDVGPIIDKLKRAL